jgi:hypothetical protein
VEVEDDVTGFGTSHIDGDNGDTAERLGSSHDVFGKGCRGEHLLEDDPLFQQVTAEIERCLAHHLVDGVPLFLAHVRSPFPAWAIAGSGSRATGTGSWTRRMLKFVVPSACQTPAKSRK